MLKRPSSGVPASLKTPMKSQVEYICRSDEFRTFNRATGRKIPELLHERQMKRTACLSILRVIPL